MKRSVFFLSDRTGITAEILGHSLLTQFEGIEFEQHNMPFIDNSEKVEKAILQINQAASEDGVRPLLFCTLLNDEIREEIGQRCEGLLLDFFETFINPLEQELETISAHAIGRSHAIRQYANYKERIEAVNFALKNDDGSAMNDYKGADIILVGVSRSGKTPTCLYLALQYGIRAANYPLTDDDFERSRNLPPMLQNYRDKLFGLTIDPSRLEGVRQERRPDSRYASYGQCQYEIREAESLYRRERVQYLDTSKVSIEEIATTIIDQYGLQRRLYG